MNKIRMLVLPTIDALCAELSEGEAQTMLMGLAERFTDRPFVIHRGVTMVLVYDTESGDLTTAITFSDSNPLEHQEN